MATQDVHSEALRLQAARVVGAFKELRDDAESANLKSGDWPVGTFAELVTQLKALDAWLAPDAWKAGAELAIAEKTSCLAI